MARRPTAPATVAPKLQLSATQLAKGIERVNDRIAELKAFDVRTLSSRTTPELTALQTAIKDTLERCFGVGTTAAKRFAPAASIQHVSYHELTRGPEPDWADETRENIEEAVALLAEAKRSLEEDLADLQPETIAADSKPVQADLSRKIFLVHGHDEHAREAVARFLERIGFEVIILHEQANQGRTIIEKFERHGDVGFAVVLMTPDDIGCAVGGEPGPRVRQNVLLELGYFMGRLGRDKVCALIRGKVEIPSDYIGVVYESMDDQGWKAALGRELQAAGHVVDWNKIMV